MKIIHIGYRHWSEFESHHKIKICKSYFLWNRLLYIIYLCTSSGTMVAGSYCSLWKLS